VRLGCRSVAFTCNDQVIFLEYWLVNSRWPLFTGSAIYLNFAKQPARVLVNFERAAPVEPPQ
jgi:hypothetical protein